MFCSGIKYINFSAKLFRIHFMSELLKSFPEEEKNKTKKCGSFVLLKTSCGGQRLFQHSFFQLYEDSGAVWTYLNYKKVEGQKVLPKSLNDFFIIYYYFVSD